MTHDRMRQLVHEYAAAKSAQDIARALAVCDDAFVLETIAFGTRSRGREETAAQLAIFFAAFPDYGVTLDGEACGDGVLTCWGEARLSLRGDIFDQQATGRTARVAFCCLFTFRDDRIASERFFFDLAALCEQVGISTDRVSAALRALRQVESRDDVREGHEAHG